MKNLFCYFKQSLELKEIGLEGECLGLYLSDSTLSIVQNISHNQFYGQVCQAPLKAQVFEFFREKYGCDVEIKAKRVIRVGKAEGYYCMIFTPNEEFFNWDLGRLHSTYEEAENACIDKIIEIVKTK